MRLPLCSSDEAIRAFERAGFVQTHRSGSHQSLEKKVGGRTIVTVVVRGKREIPRGTLRSSIMLAEMTVEEFVGYLK